MLKVNNIEESCNINPKCAEILYMNSNFIIFCTYCDLKIFNFEDFVSHFKHHHLNSIYLGLCDTKDDEGRENWPKNNLEHFDRESDDENSFIYKAENEDQKCISNNFEFEQDQITDDTHEDDNKNIKIKNKENKCNTCGRIYKTKKMLDRHTMLIHSGECNCPDCDAQFSDQKELKKHRFKNHKSKECSFCGKTFSTNSHLRRHAIRHTGDRPFKCEFENCGRMFYTNKEVKKHGFVHTGERPFVCDICGSKYRFHSELKVHRRMHTGEKPYPCEICDKRFSTKALLKEHMPMHSNERPHKCDVCNASFSRPKSLQHHKNLHLAVKKYVCKICGNAYAQAAGLASHKRIHNINHATPIG